MSDKPTRARRFLVVDDNLDSAQSLTMLLQLKGNEAEMAHSGLEAIQKAMTYKPDTVLLDIGLPEMNGYDVCRAIRKNLPEHNPLVVAVTGWGQDQDREKSRQAGFDGHLVKPIDPNQLAALLDSLTAARSKTSQAK